MAIARTLRDRLADHLQRVPMRWHDTAQTGDVVQRCTSDVDTVRLFYREQVIQIAQASARILIGLPMLIWLDWRMALAATALMPIIIGFAVVFFGRVQGSFKRADEAEGAMTAKLQENLTGIRVVRAFARQPFEVERFTAANATHRDRNWQLFKVMAVFYTTSDLLCLIQFAACVLIGGWRASRGTMTVGTMIAFVAYAQMFIWPVREVGRVLTELGKTLVAIGRIKEVLDVPEESSLSPSPGIPATRAGVRVISSCQIARSWKMALTLTLSRSTARLSSPKSGRGDRSAPSAATSNSKTSASNTATPGCSATSISSSPPAKRSASLAHRAPAKPRWSTCCCGCTTTDEGTDHARRDRHQNAGPASTCRSQFGVVLQEPFLYSKTLRDNIKLGPARRRRTKR